MDEIRTTHSTCLNSCNVWHPACLSRPQKHVSRPVLPSSSHHALGLTNDSVAAAVSLRICATSPKKVTTVTIALAGECIDSREFGGCKENQRVRLVWLCGARALIGQSNDKRVEVGDGYTYEMLGRQNREERRKGVTDEDSNHPNTH
jgi:hypothetical protein